MSQQIWRLERVLSHIGLSRPTFYAQLAKGLWTHPVHIGIRAVGWPAYEIEQLTAARIAGLSAEPIKKLARTLEEKRAQVSFEQFK